MTTFQTIILSVISGIATTMIIYTIVTTLKKIVIPWYQNVTYKGINISERWFCLPLNYNQEIQLEIKQHASNLSGNAILITKKSNEDDDNEYRTITHYEDLRNFILSGQINDRFVQIVLQYNDNQRIGLCNLLLEVRGDGRTMRGVHSFYNVASYTINSVDVIFFRSKEQAENYNLEVKSNKYVPDHFEELNDESLDDINAGLM